MGISFVLQFNQDTTTTNYLKIIAFSKKSLEKILNPKRNMNYYFRSQNSSSNCGMIARIIKKNLCNKFDLLILWAKEKNYLEIIIIILFQKIIYKISTNLMLLSISAKSPHALTLDN